MVGKTLGHYEILEPLGKGGMGEVYRARDTKLDRDVAIKVLPEDFASDPDRLARFEREAKLLASLNHANIAAIYGLEDEGDQRFIVMEVVEGETLAGRIARGPVPVAEAGPLFLQVAEGLEAAHEKGVIHRDLKPANIKVSADGRVKILDFGLAKAMAPEEPASGEPDVSQSPTLTLAATRRGEILGTAAYMSPEQARGKAVDKRADIWAFGVCLYEALTGRQAFGADTASDSMAALLTRDPTWELLPHDTPEAFRNVLRRCLEKDALHRLRDIGDARIELERLAPGKGLDAASGDSELSVPPSVAGKQASSSSSSIGRRLFVIAAVGIAVAAVGFVVVPWISTAGQPVVVVMDTASPIGVYDPATLARGESNADELTQVLAGLPIRVVKENASPLWRREHQVALLEPDLIIIHISTFVYPPNFQSMDEFTAYSNKVGEDTGASYRELLTNKAIAFFGYLVEQNPRTRFLVYSRGGFIDPEATRSRVDSWIARFPALEGRITTYRVPVDMNAGYASWSDPETAAGLRRHVVEILGLE